MVGARRPRGRHGPDVVVSPEQCPAASTHGNPFRYCGSCSWVEPPAAGTARLTDEERARFAYHPATPATGPLHDAVRTAALAYATALAAVVPAGRHRAMALTSVQESMWAANAGIACDTPRKDG